MRERVSDRRKVRIAAWLDRLKNFRDMFSTAKDVYGDLLGIDFDDSVLLSLQLRSVLGTTRIARAGIVGLTSGAITEDVITDAAALSKGLQKMVEQGNIQTKNIVFAMPGSKVAVKQIKLEKKLSDEDAEARAWQEARKAFPELVKSLFLDFAQIEQVAPDGTKKDILVLVVARKEDISPRVEALHQMGLIAKIVEVDYFAMERAYILFASQLPAKHEEKYVAIIDFNPHSILFVVMYKKSMVYYGRQTFAGDALVPHVQRAMNVDVVPLKTKASILPVGSQTSAPPPPVETKISYDKPLPFQLSQPFQPEQPVPQTQTSIQTNLLTEDQKSHIVMTIRRLFQSFYAENPGRVIEYIAMTGRCALIPEITQYIGKTMDIPLTVPNPLAELKGTESASMGHISKLGPAFALCCGIAMRGIPLWK